MTWKNVPEVEKSEYAIECCLQNLRSSDPSSIFQRNKWRKIIKHELNFLKIYHPDSNIFVIDMSDISLDKE